MKIIKRSGKEKDFKPKKISNAIMKANDSVSSEYRISDAEIDSLTLDICRVIENFHRTLNVEEIQDIVEQNLVSTGHYHIAKEYITYRYKRELVRKANTTDEQILQLIECDNEEVKQENSNKNPTIASVQRDYMAGEVSKDITKRFLLPKDIVDAHEQGIIHFHDSDYFAQHVHNCCLVNLEDMLMNGTVISETMIDPPHSFSTACNIATQAIAQIASSQYGGQSITLSHLVPFVDISRKAIRKQVEKELEYLKILKMTSKDAINKIVEDRVYKEIEKGIQTIQYQVVTLMTTNGQAPFITVFMRLNDVENGQLKDDLALLIEEMLKQRIQGVKNEKGVYITPAFPKLIYCLEEDNVKENSKYFYLTKLAAECSAKRLVPDYISEKKMRELKNGDTYTCMGCRSFLTPDRFSNLKGNLSNAKNFDKYKGHFYYGRFNQGVVTINLVDVALSSKKESRDFWLILNERLEMCHRALMCRHERLKGTTSDIAPILWQNGALARLEKGEKIDKLLFDGYSTISLGYAGLYECTKAITGYSHTDDRGKEFALSVMRTLNNKCEEWKKIHNIDFSVYGTPLESTTYKFAKCLQNRFGIIEGITDKNYITNSYHVHVTEKINAFEKLKFEAEFQELSPGGAISYIETPNMQDNLEAVISVIQYIYDNIMYAELNTKSDYCMECGFDGEIQIVEEDDKLVWECPNCGNRNQDKMNVARRTCGYIGAQFWNQGRTQEIRDRVLHVSNSLIDRE